MADPVLLRMSGVSLPAFTHVRIDVVVLGMTMATALLWDSVLASRRCGAHREPARAS